MSSAITPPIVSLGHTAFFKPVIECL
jgi:hypothetical protein